MCGIAGYVVKKEIEGKPLDKEALLDALLLEIDNRGGDATGFVARADDGRLEWHKASCDAQKFIYGRRDLPAKTTAVLAHTRYATQGHQAFPENNHPIRRGSIYLIHNGIINNDHAIFETLKRGRYGQVDSEAIAALLSYCDSLGAKCAEGLETIEGTAAIAALDERDGTVLLARLYSSPLYVLETRRLILWASTSAALTRAHETAVGSLGRAKPYYMKEGEALVWRAGVLTRFEFTPRRPKFLSWLGADNGADYVAGSYMPRGIAGTSKREREQASASDKESHTPRLALAASTSDADEREDTREAADACAVENVSSGVFHGYGNCECCHYYCDDLYDLYDGYESSLVCESCWDILVEEMPRGVRERQVSTAAEREGAA